MATYPQNFRFGEFVGSLLWLIFWIIIIVTLVGLPLLFIVLFYVPLPEVDGEVLTPYLFLTSILYPQSAIPVLQTLMASDLFRVAMFPGFTYAALIAAATIFIERKFLAKMQLRVGPLYAGKIEGILQLIADGLKLIAKEIIVPSGADKPLFWAAPIAFVATAAAVVALIPAAPGFVVADVDVGLLAVFAILGFFPLIALLFSWASNSKYPFIGGLRALHQMIAFEIPFILSALSVVILAGTLNLTGIVESQLQSYWFIFFLPISAFVFYISALAELERIPFDLPEAESEIVAGWLTETSGMIYGLIQLGSYLKTYALAALFVILFLGGWAGPMVFPPSVETPIVDINPLYNQEAANGTLWFTLKTFGMILLMLLPRGISPRIRIDILLHTGCYQLVVLAFLSST